MKSVELYSPTSREAYWKGKPVHEWIDETLRAKGDLLGLHLAVATRQRYDNPEFIVRWPGSEPFVGYWTFFALSGVPDDGTWDMQIAGIFEKIGALLDEYLARAPAT